MLGGSRIAVVVPAFDEARWIAETIAGIPSFVDLVLVVDDASRDRTSDEAAAATHPRVEVIRHAENAGVGAAITTGYRRARELEADVVAVMAGDGQMDPGDLAAVVGPVVRGEADYIKGDRLAHRDVLRCMPPARLAGTAVLAWLTKKATGLPALSDSQCGYTAIAKAAIDALDLRAIWPRYGYPNDLIGALAAKRLRIGEVVVRPVYRGEASGLRARHVVTIGWLIARIAARRALGCARSLARAS
jgi:dolichol-phosphate mannosyltransferase